MTIINENNIQNMCYNNNKYSINNCSKDIIGFEIKF